MSATTTFGPKDAISQDANDQTPVSVASASPISTPVSPPPPPGTWELWCKVGYFAMGAGMGPTFSYMSLILLRRHFSFVDMGLVVSLWPVARTVTVTPLAFLADKTRRPDVIVALCGAVSAVSCVFLFSMPDDVGKAATIAALAVFSASAASLNPLFDQHVLDLLAASGEGREKWGVFRMMLSLGYGVSTPVAGVLVGAYGWWCVGACWAVTHTVVAVVVMCTFNPSSAGAKSRCSDAKQENIRVADVAKVVASDRMLILYLGVTAAAGCGLQAINSFLFPLVETLGGGTALMGASISAMVCIEFLVFWKAEALLQVCSLHQLLFAGLVALAVRCFGYAVMQAAWLVLPLNALHGLSFACMWLAAVSFVSERFPESMGNTGMGILNMGVWGVGSLFGNIVGGALYESIGPRQMFGVLATVALAAAGCFFVCADGRWMLPSASSAKIPATLQVEGSDGSVHSGTDSSPSLDHTITAVLHSKQVIMLDEALRHEDVQLPLPWPSVATLR